MDRTKSAKIFLTIGLAICLLTLIAGVTEIICNLEAAKQNYADDPRRVADEQVFSFISVTFILFPFIAEELCFIKSVYQLIKKRYGILGTVCKSVSAVIVFAAMLFQMLIATSVIDFDKTAVNLNFTLTVSTALTVPIISFALGCVGIGESN